MREFSWLAILLGVVIGALLAAANAFVGLTVGMTLSASIPAAVISLLVLRTLLKRTSILETNMVQTVGSAGESAATGMIFTLPALFIMGHDPAFLSMVIWAGIGGLLGVCFMIPLRQVLIGKEHDALGFPEGVACAEVLQSKERSRENARRLIWGTVVGGAYYLLTRLGVWKATGSVSLERIRTEAQLNSSPALLGIGYILGARVAACMLAGAGLCWFVLIPAIAFFGGSAARPLFPSDGVIIAAMTPDDIWQAYVRYVGAGAVAVGGLVMLLKSFPTIASSFRPVLAGLFGTRRGPRTPSERDFPFILVVPMVIGLACAMWRWEVVKLDYAGAIAVTIVAFFFATISSRLVGVAWISSNAISGLTIIALLGTALVYRFLVIGGGEAALGRPIASEHLATINVTCLSVGAIVCVAISVAGDTAQDLKTGFLVKATPYKQQMGAMIGVVTSVVAIAGVLLLLNKTQGFVKDADHPYPMLAPQANMMKILVDAVLGGNVPWTLIIMGGAAAVIVEMLGLSALPFAVGMYLPLGISTPIMVGGVVRWLIDRKRKEKTEHDSGTLTAAGLVVGKGLMGVTLAGMVALIAWLRDRPRWLNPFAPDGPALEPVSDVHVVPWLWSRLGGAAPQSGFAAPLGGTGGEERTIAYWWLPDVWWDALPVVPFACLAVWLWWCARRRPSITLPPAGAAAERPADAERLAAVARPVEPMAPPRHPPPEPAGQRGPMEFDTQIGTDSDWPEAPHNGGSDPTRSDSSGDLDAESLDTDHRPDPSDNDDERF